MGLRQMSYLCKVCSQAQYKSKLQKPGTRIFQQENDRLIIVNGFAQKWPNERKMSVLRRSESTLISTCLSQKTLGQFEVQPSPLKKTLRHAHLRQNFSNIFKSWVYTQTYFPEFTKT